MSSSNKTNDIETLIANENDPKQRALLIIMSSINTCLMASASLIKEVSGKLETHIVKYDARTEDDDALLNKGKGVWIVAAWALGIVQVGAVALFIQMRQEIITLHEFAAFNKNTNQMQEVEIKALTDVLKAKP